jgi:ribosomal protein L29
MSAAAARSVARPQLRGLAREAQTELFRLRFTGATHAKEDW